MDRIGTDSGLFSDGDPAGGIKGTLVTAAWLNMIQEELANVIEGFGASLDGELNNQLFTSLFLKLKGSMTSAGTWSLTGLKINRPVLIVLDSDYSGSIKILYRTITGAYGGDQNDGYYHRLSSDISSGDTGGSSTFFIPFNTTVSIEVVESAGSNWTLRAFQ